MVLFLSFSTKGIVPQNGSKRQCFQRFAPIFRLKYRTDFCGSDRLFLLWFQAFHEPPKLLPGDGPELIFSAGPLEPAVLQSLVQENETISFPQKGLDAVATSSAEDIQRRSERIHLEMFRYQRGKSVDGLAHVGIPAGNIYVLGDTDIT
jgi:hypothetical protein